MFFPEESILAVADTHFGKSDTFRSEGLAIPNGNTEDDFVRLSKMIRDTGAERLVIMGDLIHSRESKSQLLFDMAETWRSAFSNIEMTLLMGNHDRASGKVPGQFGFNKITTFYDIGDIRLMHEPEVHPTKYVIAGHVHPGVSIKDKISSMRLPCFVFYKKFGLVPAFGSFTGLAMIKNEKDSQIFLVTDNSVMKAKNSLVNRKYS
ncbi:MAG: ligase-associated DNA damage response endonuclease PdeM [Candidatus Kapaibacteriales bacterium]